MALFLDSLFSDIDSLALHAGVHRKVFGFHRMLSHRFPWAIYCRFDGDDAVVYRLLDCRQDPGKSHSSRSKLALASEGDSRVEHATRVLFSATRRKHLVAFEETHGISKSERPPIGAPLRNTHASVSAASRRRQHASRVLHPRAAARRRRDFDA